MVIIIATSKRMTANVTIGYNNNPSKSYAFGMTMFCIINKPSSNTFAKPYTNNTPTYPRPNPLPTPPYFLLPSPPLVGEGLGMGAILLSLPCGGRAGDGAILLSLPPCGGRAGDGGAGGVILFSLRARQRGRLARVFYVKRVLVPQINRRHVAG